MEHARLLAEHGYRVLLYDARGTGASQRRPNGYGWEWDRDERGAVSFLQRQPDVDAHRIGGLGLSTGANVLIEVAATHHDLVAVVSDGATGRSLADLPEISIVERPMQWTTFTAVRLLTGSSPGPPLRALVPHVSPTPLLLIAAGSIPAGIPMNKVYADRAEDPAEVWALPDVDHTATIRQEPGAYEGRVTSFLDRALCPWPASRACRGAGRDRSAHPARARPSRSWRGHVPFSHSGRDLPQRATAPVQALSTNAVEGKQ